MTQKAPIREDTEIAQVIGAMRDRTVTPSLILKKLSAYRQQNSLAAALREIGRIERQHAARLRPLRLRFREHDALVEHETAPGTPADRSYEGVPRGYGARPPRVTHLRRLRRG